MTNETGASPNADFRSLLKQELENRCSRNPRYSLRSFARDLKLAPARLSDVLRGRYGLSRSAAGEIAKRLGWNESESAHFCDLVEAEHARSRKAKTEARSRLSSREANYQQMSLDAFQVVSDWYHYAILELTAVEGFRSEAAWIAKRLGLSPNVVVPAIDRLKRLELLEETSVGALKATNGFTASPSGIPSDAIKKFHRQVLEKALSALYLQTVEERDFSSMVLAVDRRALPEAKKAIQAFRRDFDAKYGASKPKNEVYCLAIQFFSLEERRSFIAPSTSEKKEK